MLILLLVGLAVVLGGAALCVLAKEDLIAIPAGVFAGAGVFFAIVWGIMWGATYYDTTVKVAEMQTFQDETVPTYLYTIQRTEDVIIDADGTRDGAWTDLAYQQQGMAVSDRIVELRDLIHEYNRRLAALTRKNAMPVFGSMYADVPDTLHPIRLTQ